MGRIDLLATTAPATSAARRAQQEGDDADRDEQQDMFLSQSEEGKNQRGRHGR
ncbi:MAG: hypothetical protein J5J06_14055 [Phycisphaerae bacterium]|nr:hypothetical protein [Phycisphaerae bacterium]